VLAGRVFARTDTPDTPLVAIINDTLAKHYWPTTDPVGARMFVDDQHRRSVEIVGVVQTSKYGYAGEVAQDAVYFPFRQEARGRMVLLAHTRGESAALLAPLRDQITAIDAEVPLSELQTMELFYEARVTGIGSVIIRLIGGMGVMGVTLTMVGLYGLVSYAVSRRTREIGIRIAIGASYSRILTMILRQGLSPAGAGMLAGLGLSAVTTKLLPRFIPVAHQYDARTFFLVVPMLFVVTLVAAIVPARRAANVQPTIALRCE
jgi:hypothetical protein